MKKFTVLQLFAGFPAGTVMLSLALTAGVATAQSWPAKPVLFVVPFAAGSTTDITTRILGKGLGDRLGKPVLVENRAGDGGNIGTASVAKAAPDGYTLIMGTNGPFAANLALYPKLPFDPVRDFDPVMHAVSVPLIMVANAAVTANTVQEVVQMAKARPGTLNFGVTNTTAKAWVELFKRMAGIDVVSVPYQSPASMTSNLIGGQIQFSIENVGPTLPLVKTNKIKAIALMNPTRAPYAPDVPALAESGYTQYDVVGWLAVFVPKGTPPDIIARLNSELQATLKSAEAQQAINAYGLPVGGTPAQLAALLKRDIAVWKQLVESTGIKLE